MEIRASSDVGAHKVDNVLNVVCCDCYCGFPNSHCVTVEARVSCRVMDKQGSNHTVCLTWQELSRKSRNFNAELRKLLFLRVMEKLASKSPFLLVQLLANLTF